MPLLNIDEKLFKKTKQNKNRIKKLHNYSINIFIVFLKFATAELERRDPGRNADILQLSKKGTIFNFNFDCILYPVFESQTR